MGRPRKSDPEVFIRLRVHTDTKIALQKYADECFSGNLSQAVRRVLEDEAHDIREEYGMEKPEVL